MASWRRCDRCRRVLPAEEFDGDSPTCRACLTVPVKPVRVRAGGGSGAAGGSGSGTEVTTRRAAPRPPKEEAPRRTLLGSTGSGDLEVRERRARRVALEALATSHPEEFGLLLRDARAGEGLRATSAGPAPSAPASAGADDQAGDGATLDGSAAEGAAGTSASPEADQTEAQSAADDARA